MIQFLDVDEIHFQGSEVLIFPAQSLNCIKPFFFLTYTFTDHSMSPLSDLLHEVVLVIKFCLLMSEVFFIF